MLLKSLSQVAPRMTDLWVFFFFFRPCWVACGIFVPWPRIKPPAPALEVWSLNHWIAREVPYWCLLLYWSWPELSGLPPPPFLEESPAAAPVQTFPRGCPAHVPRSLDRERPFRIKVAAPHLRPGGSPPRGEGWVEIVRQEIIPEKHLDWYVISTESQEAHFAG